MYNPPNPGHGGKNLHKAGYVCKLDPAVSIHIVGIRVALLLDFLVPHLQLVVIRDLRQKLATLIHAISQADLSSTL